MNLPGVRVGVLDLDQHDPDGVREIVEHLGLDLPILHGRGTPRPPNAGCNCCRP